MNKRAILLVAAGLLIFGAIFAVKYLQVRASMAARAMTAPPPPTVSTATAQRETWSVQLHAVSTLRSAQGIVVSNEVAGVVASIEFESGQSVAAGAGLIVLDDSIERAQLAGLEASLRLASISLARAEELRTQGSNPQAELDAARATRDQAAAAVNEVHARLAKKHIAAAFAGRLGLRRVSLGEYLAAGSEIVQLESLDPIYADFGLPQQELARVKPGMDVAISIDARPGRTFHGTIEAIDPKVSTDTMNLRIRARVANPDHLLSPGMFASVDVALPESLAVLSIPATALAHSPYGDYVYLVEHTSAGTVVQQRFVKAGPRRGDQVAILDGLTEGAEVVSTGQMKLRNGIPVRINNAVLPDNNPAPAPVEG
ncbi:multidrug resistance protein MdtA precursor [mine drainage metagenome]|uniref:Multidrug resistance protein MdtA n=1 Tax=mine drainage metagenome TaxID=410659 RepID=A0A1J5S6X1_9ZZZZ